MPRLCTQTITALLIVAAAGAAHAEPGLPLGSVFAEQRSVMLSPIAFTPKPGETEQAQTATGTLEIGARDWVYLPVDVPRGVREIQVDYQYDRPVVAAGDRGNALDIGMFDEHGIGLADASGFRGWSGGARTSFAISASEATPGYLPGPVGAGRWHVIVGPYSVAPQGLHWSVTVTLRYGAPGPAFVPQFAPERVAGRGHGWYRGDMHLHSVYSDGHRLPEEVAAGARAAGLDFMVSTEHNTVSADAIWGPLAGPDLLIINGEEITTRNGHYLALGLPRDKWIDWRYRSTDDAIGFFQQQVRGAGALAVAAHPYSPCVACSWKFGYDGMDAIEVWNGPWTVDDEAVLATWDNLLVAGVPTRQWTPAVGDSDAHSVPQVIGLPHNVVQASALDRAAVLAGVKQGKLWVAESSAVDLSFTAASAGRTAGIGERLEVDDTADVVVTLNVTGAPGSIVRLFTDEGQVFQTALPSSGSGIVTWPTRPRVSRFVRAEVRRLQNDLAIPATMVAFTNPIFLGR
jgi:hypothetical protein